VQNKRHSDSPFGRPITLCVARTVIVVSELVAIVAVINKYLGGYILSLYSQECCRGDGWWYYWVILSKKNIEVWEKHTLFRGAVGKGVANFGWNIFCDCISKIHVPPPPCVAVNEKGALLLGGKIRLGFSERQAPVYVPWHGYLFPCELTTGRVKRFHVLPVWNRSARLHWRGSYMPLLCVIRLCNCSWPESAGASNIVM